MNKAKWQRLLGAALVAVLLTTTMAPAALAAVPAAAAQQVTDASEVTALLPGGQFSKIWLALTPSNPGTVTVTAEWDRANALETGVGFYVLDENNLAAVVNGAPLPANNLGSGSSNFFLNGSSNQQGSSFNATGTAYTVVLYNDSNSDANVTLRVENGAISDDSGQVQDPNAADAEATPAAAEEAAVEATVEATQATTDTTVTTTTVAATTPVAAAAATPVATVVAGGPVRAETMQGSLPEQFNQHFLALEPSIRDGNINLVLTYDPQDSTELSRRINFWVLDTAGFQSYQDGESASAVAIAAGSRSFLDPDTSNKREASFQATGFGPYTVIVQNNSRVPATYQLAVTGGVLVDDSAQTLTAQQASGSITGTTTTTTTTVATTTTTTDTAATTTTTAAAGTGVVGTPGGSYTVVSGDTLAIIARDIYGDYRLYEQLCAFNNIADCNTIEVGQVINLPTEAEIGSVAAAPAAATTAATPVATAAATPATTTVTSTTPVTGTSAVTTTAAATGTAGVTTTTATTRTGTTTAPAAAAGTIVDLASEAGNFTILLDALQQAELDAALAGSGPFTVFAPTDAAFEALLSGNNLTEDQLLAAKELSDILQYHVLSGQLLAADMTNGSRATTLQGKPVTFEVRDGSVFVNGAELVTTDIVASNGVIHAIDAVILPPQ